MHVLALNSGSSSLKFGLYRVGARGCDAVITGEAESLDSGRGAFHAQDSGGDRIASETGTTPDAMAALRRIVRLLKEQAAPAVDAIGHRLVHGGPRLRQHCLIEGGVLEQLDAAAAFAPLHAPMALSIIREAREILPALSQIACFDTAFHRTLPDRARVLPLPRDLEAQGIQRYGFHGLSCESIVRQLGETLPPRVVIAHLGHGASITAVKDGRSIDTTMGLTPTGGLMMSTRSGDLDPSVLLYLMTEKNLSGKALEDLFDRRSGLAGVSGLSGDMRALKEAAPSNKDARLAIEMFCDSAAKQLAAMIVALGGVDLIVFAGGIGEHDADARAAICGRLQWFGIALDEDRNRAARDPVSSGASRCLVRVVPSQEDEEIARHVYTLVHRG